MSTDKQLRLLQFKVESFARIDRSRPVVIVFPPGQNYVQLEADQGNGKTSVIEALKACTGLGIVKNAINKVDNDRRTSLMLERGGRKYNVKITKTRFELEALIEDSEGEKQKWASVNSPVEAIADIVGGVGLTPMFLKEKKGKDQLEWLYDFFRLTPEQREMEQRIMKKHDEAYKSRTQVKKDLAAADSALKNDPYHIDRFDWEEKINKWVPANIEEKVKDVQKRHNLYLRAENEVKNLKEVGLIQAQQQVNDVDAEIADLERKLAEARSKKTDKEQAVEGIKTRIKTGEEFLEEHKGVVQENEDITKTIQGENDMKEHKRKFGEMLEKEKTSNHLHDEYIRLENIIDETRKAKKTFIQAITPDVPGLEICIPDEDEKREGIYYNGCTPLELSESELWGLYSKLLDALDIKIIIIENINALGSGAVEMFNQFLERGGYVLASQMNRVQKELKVTVMDKIAE